MSGLRWRAVRAALPSLVGLLASLGLVLAALAVAVLVRGTEPDNLLMDTTTVLRGPWYAGALSTLGVLFWAVAGVISLFSWWVARRADPAVFQRDFGLVSLLLLLDDQFGLHGAEQISGLGLTKKPLLLLASAAGFALCWRHRRTLFSHPDLLVLLCALGLLGVSTVFDVGLLEPRGRNALEESFKLLGSGCWALFAVRSGLRMVAPARTVAAEASRTRIGSRT